jgi:hypothetical protein
VCAAAAYTWLLIAALYANGRITAPSSAQYEYSTTITTSTSGNVAVTVRSMSARRARNGVLVRWRTASQVGTAGFNVYRGVRGKRVRANVRLVAVHGPGRGTYSFLDRGRHVSRRYWVESVGFDGSRRWFGPAPVR